MNELRPVTAKEWPEFWSVLETAFHERPWPEGAEHFGRLVAPEETLAAFEDGRIVATSAAPVSELTVPGAVLPAACVTMVGVLPTHRRRGLLTAMMNGLLARSAETRAPLAVLWASEGPIYGRFGFGRATAAGRVSIRTRDATLVGGAPGSADGVMLQDAAAGHDEVAAVYEQVRPRWPGFLGRTDARWRDRLEDPEGRRRDNERPLRVALADGGYAIYSVAPDWSDDGPNGEITVRELIATGAEPYAALWRFLLGHDLVRRATWWLGPPDEPLGHMLTDPRAVRVERRDGLWLRILDVPAALTARTYATPLELALAVDGERWRLAADGDDRACERTDADADLALSIADLGAAYLGAPVLGPLAFAGRVHELTPGALARAAAAFATPREPWCPEVF